MALRVTLACLAGLAVTLPAARALAFDERNFPRLFHLDDYSRCLSQPQGLYCLGTFSLTPGRTPHREFDLMTAYIADDRRRYNRTLLHRGYCVSSRCSSSSKEPNSTLRFERCVQQWTRKQQLHAKLQRLEYCRTHQQSRQQTPPDLWQRVFLYIVCIIVLLNVIGTIYDVVTEDNPKSPVVLLKSWSLRNNWRRLTATYDDRDPATSVFSPLQGIRVFIMLTVTIAHSGFIYQQLYIQNPQDLEQLVAHPLVMLITNGTMLIQSFIVISSFLLAYNLLQYSKTKPLGFHLLPKFIIYRISRILPVYLLVVGYAATWWPEARDGPLWAVRVGGERDMCRRKFWAHALFVNNLVEAEHHCLIQTWYLAVDMQLYVAGAVLTILLHRLRRAALPALAALCVLSTLANGLLAYIFHWDSMIYTITRENLRVNFDSVASFTGLYISPWGSLPSALIGLFLAHLHFHLQENGFKVANHPWVRLVYHMSVPAMFAWELSGEWTVYRTGRLFHAVYAAIDKPVFSILVAVYFFGLFNKIEGHLAKFFSWRGWQVMARLSLSVLMLHWCCNLTLAAARPFAMQSSFLDIGTDTAATYVLSYILAVPLTLMVEMPMQKTIIALSS